MRYYILTALIIAFAIAQASGAVLKRHNGTAWEAVGNGGPQGQRGYSGLRGLRGYSGVNGINGCTPHFGHSTTCNGQVVPGYYDGVTIKTIYVNLSGGNAGFSYNESGLSPSPASPSQWKAQFYENGSRTPIGNTTAIRYSWSATGHLRGAGNGTASTFTPTLQGGYSSHWQTNVKVLVTYSAKAGYGGKRIVGAQSSVAVTQKGQTGNTGAQGAPGLSTRSTINSIMRNWSTQYAQPTNDVWRFFPQSNDRTVNPPALMRFGNYSRVTQVQIDGAGYISFMDRNNYPVIKAGSDGTIALYVNNVKWLDMTTEKTVTVYRNGVPVHQVYSTGKWKGQEGWPTAAQVSAKKTSLYTDQYGFRKYTSSGAGGGGAGMSNPYAIPGASQTFTSAGGRTRFTFYSGQGLVIH